MSNELAILVAALLFSGTGALAATRPRREQYKRLVPVNGLLLIPVLLLMVVEGGLQLALAILIKANALMLGLVALLDNPGHVTLAHALGPLATPHKLPRLLLPDAHSPTSKSSRSSIGSGGPTPGEKMRVCMSASACPWCGEPPSR